MESCPGSVQYDIIFQYFSAHISFVHIRLLGSRGCTDAGGFNEEEVTGRFGAAGVGSGISVILLAFLLGLSPHGDMIQASPCSNLST